MIREKLNTAMNMGDAVKIQTAAPGFKTSSSTYGNTVHEKPEYLQLHTQVIHLTDMWKRLKDERKAERNWANKLENQSNDATGKLTVRPSEKRVATRAETWLFV